ncbi:MAG: hypothetical protein HY760_08070 [Nitrospirae bacterium]|nr:hypothetical protein [Nitrospirota bacterium]
MAVYGTHKPSIIFYSREYAAVFPRGKEEGVSRLLAEGRPVYLIAEERRLKNLPTLEILARGGGYVLARSPGRGAG